MLLYRWLRETAEVHGSSKALVYRETYLSWRGLLHRVDRRAQEFASIGIKEGDWVGLMLGNVPDFAILALAISRLGGILVPLDPTTGARELEMIFDVAPLRALITRPRGGESAPAVPQSVLAGRDTYLPPYRARRMAAFPQKTGKERTPEARRRLQGTLLTCSMYTPERALPTSVVEIIPGANGKAVGKDAAREATTSTGKSKRTRASSAGVVKPATSGDVPDPNAIRAVAFTTDVGGDPKGVLRSEQNLTESADSIGKTLEIKPDDRILTTVPLYHTYGFDFGLLASLRFGATLFLEDEVAPQRIAKVLRDQEITVLPGTPTLYASLAKLPTARPLKQKGARFLSGGSALTDATAEAFRERNGVRVLSVYHTTEAGAISVDRTGKCPTTVGKPFENVDLKIVDTSGAKVGLEKTGAIWVKSAVVAPGSIGPQTLVRERQKGVPIGGKDAEGWYRTGDLGRFDKGGRILLEAREDDLVKVDGKRVALGEVEGCLESFPKVKAAQARVIQDPLGGPMVVARVVPVGRCNAEEIIDHCARNLAPYKVPRRIEFCDELQP